MENTMKRIIICLMISFNVMGLFSQDWTVFHGGRGDLSRALSSYNDSISEFTGIFSSNALKILMGEIALLSGRYSYLDIFSLAQLDNRNLRLLRNMIYARYGYKFNSEDLVSYFSRFDWYNPRFDNVDNRLTDVDNYNIRAIQAFGNMNENSRNIVLNNLVGVWHGSPVVAAGYSERFIIHPNNRLEFYFSQMKNVPIASRLNGSYTIRGNVLIYSVTEIYFVMNNSEIMQGANGYEWENIEGNKLTLEKPIIFKFPVSNIGTRTWGSDLTRETITIGGQDFFKLSDDVNDR
jgi:hypothetical protein